MKKSIGSIKVTPPEKDCRLWTAYSLEEGGAKKEIPLYIDKGCYAYVDYTVKPCHKYAEDSGKKIPLADKHSGELKKVLGVCFSEFTLKFVLGKAITFEEEGLSRRVNINCDCKCEISHPEKLYSSLNCAEKLSASDIKNYLLQYTEKPLKESLSNALQNRTSNNELSEDIRGQLAPVLDRCGLKIMECNAEPNFLPSEEKEEEVYIKKEELKSFNNVCARCGATVTPATRYCEVCGNKLGN